MPKISWPRLSEPHTHLHCPSERRGEKFLNNPFIDEFRETAKEKHQLRRLPPCESPHRSTPYITAPHLLGIIGLFLSASASPLFTRMNLKNVSCDRSYLTCGQCLTSGASGLKVWAALIVLHAAEVAGTKLTSGENLTTTSHTGAWRETLSVSERFISSIKHIVDRSYHCFIVQVHCYILDVAISAADI